MGFPGMILCMKDRGVPRRFAPLPGKRAEDYRVFQALGLMNGDDPYAAGIAFQAQLRIFAGAFTAALVVEPGEQTFQTGPLQTFCL